MVNQTSPLGAAIANLRISSAAPRAADSGMLSNALYSLIAAIFARILGRLEPLVLLWQAGTLPTPIPRQAARTSTPSAKPRHPRGTQARHSHARQTAPHPAPHPATNPRARAARPAPKTSPIPATPSCAHQSSHPHPSPRPRAPPPDFPRNHLPHARQPMPKILR